MKERKIQRLELKANIKMLEVYRAQLLARHKEEPLKSPPLFLLNAVILNLDRLASRK